MASIQPIKTKTGIHWRVLIRKAGAKPQCKTFRTKAQANTWAKEQESDAPTVLESRTVGELIQAYRELREIARPILDTSNEHYMLRNLDRDLGEYRADRLTVANLIAWAKRRKEDGAGPYTVNMELSKLGTVFRYAGEGLPDIIGAARPKLAYAGLIGGGGKRERRPTEDELARIENAMPEQYRDVIRFMVATAMRRSEVCRLKWSDLDREKRLILVRDRKDPRNKSGNDQWIPLVGRAWEIVIRRGPSNPDLLFPHHPQTLSKEFRRVCVELAIPDLHLHDLRHEGVSRLFEAGYSIEQVALVSGHKDWRHLKRYTQIKPETLSLPARDTEPDAQQHAQSPRIVPFRQRKS